MMRRVKTSIYMNQEILQVLQTISPQGYSSLIEDAVIQYLGLDEPKLIDKWIASFENVLKILKELRESMEVLENIDDPWEELKRRWKKRFELIGNPPSREINIAWLNSPKIKPLVKAIGKEPEEILEMLKREDG